MNRKLMVILPNNLGDVLMTIPVIESLKVAYSQSTIDFILEKGFEGGIEKMPELSTIYKLDRKAVRQFSFDKREWKVGLNLLKEFVDSINTKMYSAVINFSQHEYISYLVSSIHTELILGRFFSNKGNNEINDLWSQYLYAIPFARKFNSLHVIDIYRKIAGVASIPCANQMTLEPKEINEAKCYLQSKGVDLVNDKVVIFQPGAALPSKRWPIEHFVILGKSLVADGWKILLTGAPAEKELTEALTYHIGKHSIDSAGERTFRETIALVSFAKACVTGDTAIMHAAAALKICVYALFGPTNPVETGPYSDNSIVFSGRCSNRPCFCFKCKSQLCMKSITPQIVYNAINNNFSLPGCDIYKTYFAVDKTYSLKSMNRDAFQYYNIAGAKIVRSAFEENSTSETLAIDESFHLEITKEFLLLVGKMRDSLNRYVCTSDGAHIKEFESLRNKTSLIGGICDFWVAILNIRLNSVSVMDPQIAVNSSIHACTVTIDQLSRIVPV